jgi:hypothetical protein
MSDPTGGPAPVPLRDVSVIGIDVGGTNTDAIRLRGGCIVASAKVPTTADIEGGLLAALAHVSDGQPIELVYIGTTALTNALVERRHLQPAAAIRVGAPVSESLPPMIDEGLDEDCGRRAEIAFKNEYLILRVDEQVALTVPDLITVVETHTGTPITTEVVRPGLCVSILGLRSSPLYHTPEALQVVGPRAFGYDVPFVGLE